MGLASRTTTKKNGVPPGVQRRTRRMQLLALTRCFIVLSLVGVSLAPFASQLISGSRSTTPDISSSFLAVVDSFRQKPIAFEAIPAEKRLVVMKNNSTGLRYDVESNVKMGVQIDWMTASEGDWEAVGTDGQQRLHGFYGMTPKGKPAWRPKAYIHYKTESLQDKTKHHANFSFNKWRSDRLPLSLPRTDQRSPECRTIADSGYYQGLGLPNTSVVFVAYNEPLSTLFRSLHSVLDRTPPELLHEIILVDDGSDVEAFGEELENYIALLPKTKLYRLAERKGLMAARSYGAEMSTGGTITFLDSHIEAIQGWLPPLLERIAIDRRTVTMPVIDSIDPDTWEYSLGGISILGFNWHLGQSPVPRRRPANKTQPMPSPVMAGGLFTIDRNWFFELGGYDPELMFWGGEEMEISFKIWQCGGRLECIPCSGVGHIFRSHKHWQGSVYHVPSGFVGRNRLRTAMVWMDDKHIKLVKDSIHLPSNMSVGDLTARHEIRERLQCKSFQWYLDTVYPELFFPEMNKFNWVGEVRHIKSNMCLDTMGRKKQGERLGVFPCHHLGGPQQFAGSIDNEIRVPGIGWDICVDGNGGRVHKEVILYNCHGAGGAQNWTMTPSGQLRVSGLCLTYNTGQGGRTATLEVCSRANHSSQIWTVTDTRKNVTADGAKS